jgi:ribonuclease E
VALYILNQKRHILKDIEQRYRITITVNADEQLHGGNFHIDKAAGPVLREPAAAPGLPAAAPAAEERPPAEEEAAESEGEGARRKRRRRRRRRGERAETPEPIRADYQDAEPYEDDDEDETDFVDADAGEAAEGAEDESDREARAEGGQGSGRRRRRGRRGGRRSRGARADSETQTASAGAEGDEDEESSAWEPAGEESLADDTMSRAAWAVEEEIETAGNGRNGGGHRVEVEPLPEVVEPHGEAEPAPSPVWSEPLAPMAEAEPATAEEPSDEPVSRRRGWWQRRLSGPNG